MRASGVRIDHVAGDREYYRLSEERVVLPERSQFPSQDAYTHTALHELGHATGHPSRLNRPPLIDHGGFGSEAYSKEELRAEIAAMMTGKKLGVGHEPRHGTAYVGSWVKALENDPREIRADAVDAQRISDWLMARERERAVTEEQPAPEPATAKRGWRRHPSGRRCRSGSATRESGRRNRTPGRLRGMRDPTDERRPVVRRAGVPRGRGRNAPRRGRRGRVAPFPEGKMSRERPAR